MPAEPLVVARDVGHHFGTGSLRKQILHEVSLTVQPGEIMILTGPSGSGKTTLLTLIGALRSVQDGSLVVLGAEMRDAAESVRVRTRRQIGYIFQLHNLMAALTAQRNVMMGLAGADIGRREAEARARDMLERVGLGGHAGAYPGQLSGGQKQRVAIARALAGRPRVILADEPTASLDRQSGREVVDRIQHLAKREGTAVLLVTHDSRILDVADRIVHLEEGRLSGFADAVLASTQQLLGTLAKSGRSAEILHQVAEMPAPRFREFLSQITTEAQRFLEVMAVGADDAFEIMLDQMLEACTFKVGQLFEAERVSLLLGDEARGELWSKVVQAESGRPIEIRIPIASGISGHVYRTGEALNLPDAHASPLFNPTIDRATGYRTRALLCVPVTARGGRTLGVLNLLNKRGEGSFDQKDADDAMSFATSIGVILQTWQEATQSRRAQMAERVAAPQP